MASKDTFISGFDLSDYDDTDFGITAVSEEELTENSDIKSPVEPTDALESQQLQELTSQVNLILEQITAARNLNESTVLQNAEMTDSEQSQKLTEQRQEWDADLLALEKLSLPLLISLSKPESLDKQYIRWDNRGPVIKAQMERILAITRKHRDE